MRTEGMNTGDLKRYGSRIKSYQNRDTDKSACRSPRQLSMTPQNTSELLSTQTKYSEVLSPNIISIGFNQNKAKRGRGRKEATSPFLACTLRSGDFYQISPDHILTQEKKVLIQATMQSIAFLCSCQSMAVSVARCFETIINMPHWKLICIPHNLNKYIN